MAAASTRGSTQANVDASGELKVASSRASLANEAKRSSGKCVMLSRVGLVEQRAAERGEPLLPREARRVRHGEDREHERQQRQRLAREEDLRRVGARFRVGLGIRVS